MTQNKNGFTLIEMIGVLTIIAIIASALVPNISREITRAIADAEDSELNTIALSLKKYISENQIIPGTATGQWNTVIAPFIENSSNRIINNRGSGTRRLILRTTNGIGSVPYDQSAIYTAGITPQGSLPITFPVQMRLLLVSNLSGAVPVSALTDAQFDAVWDQTGVIPAGFATGNKFRIERMSLASLFFPVTISCTSLSGVPRWSINTAIVKSLNLTTFTVYLLSGTRINLFQGAVPAGTIVVNKAVGIIYDGTAWSY
jgi:prepilin-type N-terminal cleavage/methylation domain-containing protein